jgi:hypothetical protein
MLKENDKDLYATDLQIPSKHEDKRRANLHAQDTKQMQDYFRQNLTDDQEYRIQEEMLRARGTSVQGSKRSKVEKFEEFKSVVKQSDKYHQMHEELEDDLHLPINNNLMNPEPKQKPFMNDPFIDKIEKPRNCIQWLLFNSEFFFNKEGSGTPASIEIAEVLLKMESRKTHIEQYYLNFNAKNSNMQIC